MPQLYIILFLHALLAKRSHKSEKNTQQYFFMLMIFVTYGISHHNFKYSQHSSFMGILVRVREFIIIGFFSKVEISCKKPIANLHQTLQLSI